MNLLTFLAVMLLKKQDFYVHPHPRTLGNEDSVLFTPSHATTPVWPNMKTISVLVNLLLPLRNGLFAKDPLKSFIYSRGPLNMIEPPFPSLSLQMKAASLP